MSDDWNDYLSTDVLTFVDNQINYFEPSQYFLDSVFSESSDFNVSDEFEEESVLNDYFF
jgi:regulator of sirC expression with transglutaminase-like and TPR domain